MSECVLKTLACRGLRVLPSKFRKAYSERSQVADLVAPLKPLNAILSLLHHLDHQRTPSAIGTAIVMPYLALSRIDMQVGVLNRLVLNHFEPRDSVMRCAKGIFAKRILGGTGFSLLRWEKGSEIPSCGGKKGRKRENPVLPKIPLAKIPLAQPIMVVQNSVRSPLKKST